MKVLIVAAHPDDEILGVGATAARHAADGDDVVSVVVSEGASSRYDEGADSALVTAGRKAARVLGVREVRFFGLPDQRLDTIPVLDVIRKVEAVVDEIVPDVVYTHHWGDLNRDHRVVHEAVMVACRPVGGRHPKQLHCFETPSSSEWSSTDLALQFVPSHFVDVSGTLQKKLDAMACYESEVRPAPHPRALESLRSRAAYWGQIVGKSYAEPFVTVRSVR